MVNEVQRFDILAGVDLTGPPQPFTLGFRGGWTANITYQNSTNKPSVADVQAALDGLSTIGPGNVVVTQDVPWGYVCSFQNDLGDEDLPMLDANDTQLTTTTVQVSDVTHGSPPIDTAKSPFASLELPVTLHRLMLGMQNVFVVTPGIHHQIVVSTDGTSIILSPAE